MTIKPRVYVVDTNVLMRYLLKDDIAQFNIVEPYFLQQNHHLYLSIMTLCESVWIMQKKLKIERVIILSILEKILSQKNVLFEREIVNYGLDFMKNGGDFADGIIAYKVHQVQNSSLLTFDKKSQKLCQKLNIDYIKL